jgi:acetylglutamate kinase
MVDLGFVGEPARINTDLLEVFENTDIVPVIAPIGVGGNGQTFNINADTAAGAIAAALKAKRLLMLTDVRGVLDASRRFLPVLPAEQARRLIAEGVISGGMIPKIETCLAAVERGVEAAVVLDGRVPHAILLELFTEHGFGTEILGAAG